MSEIVVKPLEDSKAKEFLKFAWNIYQDDPNWVPPLFMDKLKILNKKKNPFYKNADMQLFMAYQNGKLVMKIESAEETMQVFDKDCILANSEKFWTIPREKKIDICKVQYIDPDNEYARVYATAEADEFLNEQPIVQEPNDMGPSFENTSISLWKEEFVKEDESNHVNVNAHDSYSP